MITLHRIGHPDEELLVNHDMIVAVEANPDTVIRLTGGEKIIVAEAPAEVAEKVLICRAHVDVAGDAIDEHGPAQHRTCRRRPARLKYRCAQPILGT